jgi:type IV secretory pathway TrbD component
VNIRKDEQSTAHRVYRAMNKSMTFMGCDSKILGVGMFAAGGVFASFLAFKLAVIVFACFAIIARYKAKDPVALRAYLNPGRYRAQYDPGKRVPFQVVFYDHKH